MLSFHQGSLEEVTAEARYQPLVRQSCKLLSAPTTFALVDFRGRDDGFSSGGFYMLRFDSPILLS